MIKSVILLFWILNPFFTRSQSIEYIGPINTELTKIMTPNELLLYSECIVAIGKEKEHLKWVDSKTQTLFINNPKNFTHLSVSINSVNRITELKYNRGKQRLGEEKVLLSFNRNRNQSSIEVFLFY
jgi:hypothetical protein